jgi:alkylated DNA repair protein (DNA oxidative demethylase)
MTGDLFAEQPASGAPERIEALGPGAAVLRGMAMPWAPALHEAVGAVVREAPWRHMLTPGGHAMQVAMTNCGSLGWTSDRRGYRYTRTDPASGRPWPAMPAAFLALAAEAAALVGFDHFVPDACLVNRYLPGHKLALHQDRDEADLSAPIVSVSLGLPAIFQFGGHARGDRPVRVPLGHGDVVVWGGPDRLRFHGVLTLKPGDHPALGGQRINLTMRQAGPLG